MTHHEIHSAELLRHHPIIKRLATLVLTFLFFAVIIGLLFVTGD